LQLFLAGALNNWLNGRDVSVIKGEMFIIAPSVIDLRGPLTSSLPSSFSEAISIEEFTTLSPHFNGENLLPMQPKLIKKLSRLPRDPFDAFTTLGFLKAWLVQVYENMSLTVYMVRPSKK